MSCEGPQGPAGPAGADGANGTDGINGTNGTDGQDGVDGRAVCLVCHSATNMDAISAQYETSVHGIGARAARGTSASCARCHSNEGFQDYVKALATGQELVGIAVPTRISCETCHGNHFNFDGDIEPPMRTTAAVTSIVDNLTFDFPDPMSNLCANCHQARSSYAEYEAVDSLNGVAVGVDSVAISSSHGGPHHGPQANTINGYGGYTTLTSVVTNPMHFSEGCTGCHMAESTDATQGGHTYTPALEKCQTCHSTATDFDMNGHETEWETRMDAIAQALVAKGAMSGDATNGYHVIVGIYPKAVFEAWWNYVVMEEDRSKGAHNPAYFDAMLDYAEANLGITK